MKTVGWMPFIVFEGKMQRKKKRKTYLTHHGGEMVWVTAGVIIFFLVSLILQLSPGRCNLQFQEVNKDKSNSETFSLRMDVYLCSFQVVNYRIALLQSKLTAQQLGSVLGQGESKGFVCHHLTIEQPCIGPQKKRSQLSAGQFHFFVPCCN